MHACNNTIKSFFSLSYTSEATLTPFDNFDISVTGAFTRNAGRVMVSGAVKNAPSVAGTELLENNLSLDAYHWKNIFFKDNINYIISKKPTF